MIGHYLLTLSEKQEDRVLTTKMRPGAYCEDDMAGEGPCLVGTAGGERSCGFADDGRVTIRYDKLCFRFGVARVNTAIRARIWSNRAHRLGSPASHSKSESAVGARSGAP